MSQHFMYFHKTLTIFLVKIIYFLYFVFLSILETFWKHFFACALIFAIRAFKLYSGELTFAKFVELRKEVHLGGAKTTSRKKQKHGFSCL